MAAGYDPDDDTRELPESAVPPPPAKRPAPLPPPAPPAAPTGYQPQPAPPTAGWQRPIHVQQPGPPPAYWQAARYPTNSLVVLAAVILLVFGLLVTIVGVIGLMGGMFIVALLSDLLTAELATAFDVDAFATVVLVGFGVVLTSGLLHLLSSIGIFMHRGWARAIGALLAALGTMLGGAGIAFVLQDAFPGQDVGRALTIPAIVAVGYGLSLLALIVGGSHFRRRY